jgi:hypothetical protein
MTSIRKTNSSWVELVQGKTHRPFSPSRDERDIVSVKQPTQEVSVKHKELSQFRQMILKGEELEAQAAAASAERTYQPVGQNIKKTPRTEKLELQAAASAEPTYQPVGQNIKKASSTEKLELQAAAASAERTYQPVGQNIKKTPRTDQLEEDFCCGFCLNPFFR